MLHRGLKSLLLIVLLAVGVSGCYIPARFDAEINIGLDGNYKFQFEGYLAEVTLFNQLQSGKLTPEQEAEKVELLRTDFMRDSATKEFSYFKQGHFKVKWEKQGDLLRSRMVSFVRRNENMFSLIYNKNTSMVTVRGTSISKANARRLIEMGLTIRGQLRVVTDAKVLKHNAVRVKKGKGREKIYVWNIKSPSTPSPKLEFILR
jgi:transposase